MTMRYLLNTHPTNLKLKLLTDSITPSFHNISNQTWSKRYPQNSKSFLSSISIPKVKTRLLSPTLVPSSTPTLSLTYSNSALRTNSGAHVNLFSLESHFQSTFKVFDHLPNRYMFVVFQKELKSLFLFRHFLLKTMVTHPSPQIIKVQNLRNQRTIITNLTLFTVKGLKSL